MVQEVPLHPGKGKEAKQGSSDYGDKEAETSYTH